ncbi:MAG TPA: sodium:calcium antiporter [Candidatus Brocadiia bacterium]
MNTIVSIVLFIVGLGLVIYFAEKLVKGALGTSLGFGIPTFLVSVIFIGFDPENLAVGAIGSFEGVAGIALGSIIGATMVAIALAFGITALFAPMRFAQVPKQILTVPICAVLLLSILGFDGALSRIDGAILLFGFILSVVHLFRLSKRGIDIKPRGEVAETLAEAESLSKWKSFGIFLLSLAAIIIGSEMLVAGSETIITRLGLSDAVFGMTILAFLVSIEELARELPAAIKGRPEISFGNVVGSILAFFLFNAGIIALVRPVAVDAQVLRFYLPLCFITTVVVCIFMMTKKIPRWAGGILVLLYLVFVIRGYVR